MPECGTQQVKADFQPVPCHHGVSLLLHYSSMNDTMGQGAHSRFINKIRWVFGTVSQIGICSLGARRITEGATEETGEQVLMLSEDEHLLPHHLWAR